MTSELSVPFDFGWKLSGSQEGKYTCPVCGKYTSLSVNTTNATNITFTCDKGCTQHQILSALGVDGGATVYAIGSSLVSPVHKTEGTTANCGLSEGYTINEATAQSIVPFPSPPERERRREEKKKDDDFLSETYGPQEGNRLTLEVLESVMGVQNYTARHNVITQEIEVSGKTLTGRQMDYDDLVTTLHSSLTGRLKGCTTDNIIAYTAVIAKNHEYNPILDLLEETQWDGESRVTELYKIMGIEDDPFSCTLVYKWLLQGVALLFNDLNDPFGAEGALVLSGEQSACKTSLLKHLAIKSMWFLEGGEIKAYDKDTKRRVVTHWISELGELGSTFRKTDIDELKAFVTNSVDEYRVPYARRDRKVVRRTNLCATCNPEQYLVDPTGNRRWWSVKINKPIEREEIEALDALQLWAEIYTIVSKYNQKEKAACFRLSRSELEELRIRNAEFETPITAEEECRDILTEATEAGDLVTWRNVTITEWISQHKALQAYSSVQVGKALKRIGIQQDRSNSRRYYFLPDPIPSVAGYNPRNPK